MTAKQLSLAFLIILSPMHCSASFWDFIFKKQEVPKMHPAKTAEFHAIKALLMERLRNTSIELDKAQLHATSNSTDAHPNRITGCLNCERIEILKGQKAGAQEAASFLVKAIQRSEENEGAEVNATFQAAGPSKGGWGRTNIDDDKA